jgi:hypothetical protein
VENKYSLRVSLAAEFANAWGATCGIPHRFGTAQWCFLAYGDTSLDASPVDHATVTLPEQRAAGDHRLITIIIARSLYEESK